MDIPTCDQIRAGYLLVEEGGNAVWNPKLMTDERIGELLRDGCRPLLEASLDPNRPMAEQVKEAAKAAEGGER